MRKQMQKEYEQRVLCETKLAQTGKQLKVTRAENTSLENDITKLIKAIEEMKEEQRYLQEMRGMPIEDDDEARETEDEQFMRRIAEGAEEAAAFYRRLSDETRREFKFIQEKHELASKESQVAQSQTVYFSLDQTNQAQSPRESNQSEARA